MTAPAFTLKLMNLEVPQQALPFIDWIGAFVFAVGVCYFLAFGGVRESRAMVWRMTALARSVVAVFLIWKISEGSLAIGWITVAATDTIVALVQWVGLKRRWI